jgi:hypothetical protein
MGYIRTKEDFEKNFNLKLGDKFILQPFDFKDRLKNKIEMVCKICSKSLFINYYNALDPKNCRSCFAKVNADKRHESKWMERDAFIKLLPEKIDYNVLSEKINLNHKVLVENEFGQCLVLGRRLVSGTPPNILNAINPEDYRINAYKKIHGNKFSYPDYTYSKNTDIVKVLCNNCRHSFRIIDSNLMRPTAGCPKCEKVVGAPLMTNADFLNRVLTLKLDIEILEDYISYHTNILVKNKYGLCKIQPGNILKGNTGSLRSALDKTSYMIEQFKEKHSNKYTYDKYEYCGNRCIGTITCPTHGDFEQLTDVHLMGSGCSKCGQENRVNGFGRTDFISMANGRVCTFYIIRCVDQNECFYKMGITARGVKSRYKTKDTLPYKYEIVFEHKSIDAAMIWDKELLVKQTYKSFRQDPLKYFKGSTECFNLEVPVEEIKNLFLS